MVRVKNIRKVPVDGAEPSYGELADGIGRLLPPGSQFAAIVLLPGGLGRFVASAEGPHVIPVLRQLLDAAEAGEDLLHEADRPGAGGEGGPR